MKRSFVLSNLKPFSINAAYCTQGNSRIKTQAFREWQTEVFFQLDLPEPKAALKELREYFDETKHCFHIMLTVFYPKEQFYTKKGLISARTQDVSNWEKPLIDCIFLPKHFNTPVPYGCENLNIDDKFLTRCVSEKSVSEESAFEIWIQIEVKSLYQESHKINS